MDFHRRWPHPRPPASPYTISLARRDATLAIAVAPALFWAVAAAIPVSLGVGVAGGVCLLFPANPGAYGAREAVAVEDQLAEARGRFDALKSRRLLDEALFERRFSELLAREARLEQRDSVVAALARRTVRAGAGEEARAEGGALRAIQTLSPSLQAPAFTAGDSPARAYAPLPAPDVLHSHPPAPKPAKLSAAAANPNLDLSARLDLANMALDRIESGQMISLAAIDRAAAGAAGRKSEALTQAGLDPNRFASAGASVPPAPPANAPAFDRAAARVARDVAAADDLAEAVSHAPLRKPLPGDPVLTSPFGYRPDPFLGRPMLHPGIDLLEPYGTEIHAAGAGRVARAGWEGGYGGMVEIDHGHGVVTRYGHMSSVLVSEGQEVAGGAPLGRLGSTGRSTGPHLHYEVRIDGEPVDPERFLRAGARLGEAE